MTKTELIDSTVSRTGYSKVIVENILNTLTDVVTDTLSKNDKVSIRDFGVFSVTEHKAKTGKVPGTDKEWKVDARKVPKFTFSKTVKNNLD
jgi:DNA-binding protein HU-beta